MVAIASGNSTSNTFFHKEWKLHNNVEKCEKNILKLTRKNEVFST